jgi:hypothetical protein
MSTAAARFATLPELVRCLVHHVFYSRNMSLLSQLCTVNSVFRAVVTPYRFMELCISGTIADTKSKGRLHGRFDLVRTACFSEYYTGLPAEEELLRHMFSQMSRLQHLEYVQPTASDQTQAEPLT